MLAIFVVVVLFYTLKKARVLWEEISIEKIPPIRFSCRKACWAFFGFKLIVDDRGFPWAGGWRKMKAEQAIRGKPVSITFQWTLLQLLPSAFCLGFLWLCTTLNRLKQRLSFPSHFWSCYCIRAIETLTKT